MPPMSNVVVKIPPVTQRPINYSTFPHPTTAYIYIHHGSRLKLPVASRSCRFPIHKIDTLQLIPRILGRVSHLPYPVKGNDIFADCCGILSWLRMEIMGRGSRSDARPRRFGNIITVWPRHAYTERVSRSTRAPIPSTHFSRAYAIERGCSLSRAYRHSFGAEFDVVTSRIYAITVSN